MKRIGIATLVLCAFLCFAWGQTAGSGKIIRFNVPGAQGTVGQSIATDGSVAGAYTDSNGVLHGFLRSVAGKYTKFDPPDSVGTYTSAVNSKLAVTGSYKDTNGAFHGFVRSPKGKITPFDAPGAGKGNYQGTLAYAINSEGEVVGYYTGASQEYHAFFRTAGGKVTGFEAPGAGKGSTQGTIAVAVNDGGAISGNYVDSNNSYHGFVRAANGTFTSFEVPQSSETYVSSINAKGTVAGTYDGSTGTDGFLRLADGKMTLFGPATGGVYVGTINDAGAVVGSVVDNNNYSEHGYVRSPGGKITYFNVPGAGNALGQGTYAYANNASGQITGAYVDSNGVGHGFVRQ
jgi:probable HAF family extracellular repeat protein